ncbi:hypothetical protein LY78DRAFT_663827 [Colletotrichum sublineola]|nr:hypothetical protein LY78DRAFT_663827 [Colletotrichum sublineola]
MQLLRVTALAFALANAVCALPQDTSGSLARAPLLEARDPLLEDREPGKSSPKLPKPPKTPKTPKDPKGPKVGPTTCRVEGQFCKWSSECCDIASLCRLNVCMRY